MRRYGKSRRELFEARRDRCERRLAAEIRDPFGRRPEACGTRERRPISLRRVGASWYVASDVTVEVAPERTADEVVPVPTAQPQIEGQPPAARTKPRGGQAEELMPRKKKAGSHGRGAKAAFIRDWLKKMPSIRPKDLVVTAAQEGLSISETQVYGILAAEKRKASKTSGRAGGGSAGPKAKPGRKPAAGSGFNGAAHGTISERDFIRAVVLNGIEWAREQMAKAEKIIEIIG